MKTIVRICAGNIILLLWILCSPVAMAQTMEGFSIQEISDSVFARMQGKSFPDHCTVARSDLRYLQMLHVDAKGKTHQGEMVCNKAIAEDVLEIFQELYRQKYPIERMRLIDDYDADDEQSMRDNNSSSFCYRVVEGSTKLSKHAQGMAVDVNTLYNPCVRKRKDGTVLVQPSTAKRYTNRSRKFPYKIVEGDLMFRLFTERGFQWGGHWKSLKDYQHFEK